MATSFVGSHFFERNQRSLSLIQKKNRNVNACNYKPFFIATLCAVSRSNSFGIITEPCSLSISVLKKIIGPCGEKCAKCKADQPEECALCVQPYHSVEMSNEGTICANQEPEEVEEIYVFQEEEEIDESGQVRET